MRRYRRKTSQTQDATPALKVSVATRQRILDAARLEFATQGFSGARVERIATQANINIQLLYHHFGDKERLYFCVLKETYSHIRNMESTLSLDNLEPLDAVKRLVGFTFDYLVENPSFTSIIRNENMNNGHFVKKIDDLPKITRPLIESIDKLIDRGVKSGDFVRRPDVFQFYVTVLGMTMTHIANRHTLSAMFALDISDCVWLKERRAHVIDVVCSYLTGGS